jgi:hypothetical protein
MRNFDWLLFIPSGRLLWSFSFLFQLYVCFLVSYKNCFFPKSFTDIKTPNMHVLQDRHLHISVSEGLDSIS